MKNRSWKNGGTFGLIMALSASIGAFAAATPDRTLVGRLTDAEGVSVAGATVMVFPAAANPMAADSLLVRTDAAGEFIALLPPGRYVVAAVKRGFDVSMTEVHSLSGRVLQMRLRASLPAARRTGVDLGADLLVPGERSDVLRDEDPVLAPAVFISRQDDDGPLDPPHAGAGAPDPSRALLGALDGEVMQSLGAGELLGLESGAPMDAARATTVSLRAPLRPGIGWQFDGLSLRTRSDIPEESEHLAGRSDRMAFAIARAPESGEGLRGRLSAGLGNESAGDLLSRDATLQGNGELEYGSRGSAMAFALQAWGTRTGAEQLTDAMGLALYAGDRRALGLRTRIDYGLEYRGDSISGQGRIVPRVGITHQAGFENPVTVSSELLLDATQPGVRLSVEGRPGDALTVAAAILVLPANAAVVAGPFDSGDQPARALEPAATHASDLREVDLSLSRDFGPLSGSLTGSLGRTGPRAVPVIEQGPLPLVSYGGERYYETRIGIAYRPWSTEMQLAYRSVSTETEPEPTPAGAALDYRRIDLVVSQGLPSPRALLGARLHALLAWQGLDYAGPDAAAGGATLAGLASRLSGGVGLSF
ncbi:MAG TPA: carboxypeptidase-like regulatory domain-containing protein [Patescibacteria group bacterium]|nr:carboxypeptidase-like regulatory domain-containing protein [Patescibacteria group bacterium]